MGKEKFRAGQILRWVYQRGATEFSAMTDLAKDFRADLEQRAFISDWQPEHTEQSQDGTKKYLFRLDDGESVESVRIPMDGGRATLCISSQVGCAMQCEFCLTGNFGLTRNLTAGEIVNQVCAALKDGPINNIVFMGMGEPLHNLDNVLRALEIFYVDEGLAFSPRKVTVSTSGLIPEMRRIGQFARVNLAVSLNATTDEVRDRLMPINKRYPLKVLIAACRDYPMPSGQWITFEYILIQGVNDSQEDAKRLVKLLHVLFRKCQFKTSETFLQLRWGACSCYRNNPLGGQPGQDDLIWRCTDIPGYTVQSDRACLTIQVAILMWDLSIFPNIGAR